jgi:hypothetical protein
MSAALPACHPVDDEPRVTVVRPAIDLVSRVVGRLTAIARVSGTARSPRWRRWCGRPILDAAQGNDGRTEPTWPAAAARCTVNPMSDHAAIRAWHGRQPGGHRSDGPTLTKLPRNDDGKLAEFDVSDRQNRSVPIAAVVPTPAAWWCDCGEPLHGGYAPIAPKEYVVKAFEGERRR